MKIQDIIAIANQAYPDGQIAQHWDEKKNRPVGDRKARELGDTLAHFIALELNDTFDKDATDEQQFTEAIRVMQTARIELEGIEEALFAAANEARLKALQGPQLDPASTNH